MTSLRDIVGDAPETGTQKPWPRIAVGADLWRMLAERLAAGECDLLALWCDGADVHMALRAAGGPPLVASRRIEDGAFPSVGRLHAPAQRLERAMRDIYGVAPSGLEDERGWFDHGVWGVRHPGGARQAVEAAPAAYRFLRAEGAPLHQIPVGPVHAGIIEPGHFRFSANGETVVRLEERLGYVHKGVETLMRGADLARAAQLAARVSGDSTVAWSFAFARAVETALGVEATERATLLRSLMAELERVANHLGDIGAVCNDAAFSLMQAHCAVLREQVLRACRDAFGHRLMMDRIVPGGVAVDLTPEGATRIREALEAIDATLPALVALYENTTSLQDRTVGTGRVGADLVKRFACGGHVGRASGRAFDARRDLPYAPYDVLSFDVVSFAQGDVDARVRVRIGEAQQSVSMIRQILVRLPTEAVMVELPRPSRACEGVAMVESFRGEVFVWVRLDAAGAVAHCHLRDPSWFQWPLLEAAIEGNIVADFPLCNKSFNCSYSGHDL